MNLDQIRQTLEDMFRKQPPTGANRRILFWYDAKGEFAEDVEKLELSNAKIWRLTETNNFLTKYTIEELEPHTNFLIYSNQPRPDDHDNWFLDTLLYSSEFSADRISMVMNELNVPQSLRGVFTRYERFFRSKDRTVRFVSYGVEDYSERTVDVAVLSVLAGQKSSNFADSLRAVFCESLNEDENRIWQEILKFGDEEAFWQVVDREFGYTAPRKNLETLFISLVITAFAEQFHGDLPQTWQDFLLRRTSNCVVFIDHFMKHAVDGQRFAELVGDIEDVLHLSTYLEEWELHEIRDADVFPSLDKAVIIRILRSLLNGAENFSQYEDVIIGRRTKHFYGRYEAIYDAIYWAIQLFRFRKEHRSFVADTADVMFEAYANEYYRADYAYRKFCLAYSKAKGLDLLHHLSEAVENLYCNWFLPELAVRWSKLVEDELAGNWLRLRAQRQQHFYQTYIEPVIKRKGRVFVIVSDALRYEAGHELAELLNQSLRGVSKLDSLQGVVPSYTQLGMAVLLPYQKLEITGSEVLVDSVSSAGLENRQRILQRKETDSIALHMSELVQMDRQTLRNTVKGKHVVYVYHNTIDAIGDNAQTEERTFEAVERALEEIVEAVDLLTKNLTEVNLYITSDHGFIYQRRPLEESDKTQRSDVTPISSNRRFMLFDEPVDVPSTLSIELKYLLGSESTSVAVVPKGHNRYRLQGGGQRFVHGGASLQEIVIPLVHFTNDRKKDPSKEVTKVDVRLTTDIRRITNSIFTLNFFQTEPVGGKKTARQLKAYFIDPDGNIISDEVPLLADSESTQAEERNLRLRFNLKSQTYDRSVTYYLILEDIEETVEKVYDRVPFLIDLGIMHDFDF